MLQRRGVAIKPDAGLADGGGVARRTRLSRPLVAWCLLALLLWLAQVAWLAHRLAQPTWGEYWHWRGVYRPGLQTLDATAGDFLPGYVFHPLSPTGARVAFVLSAAVYAMAVTGLAWLALRATSGWRQRAGRRLRRSLA